MSDLPGGDDTRSVLRLPADHTVTPVGVGSHGTDTPVQHGTAPSSPSRRSRSHRCRRRPAGRARRALLDAMTWASDAPTLRRRPGDTARGRCRDSASTTEHPGHECYALARCRRPSVLSARRAPVGHRPAADGTDSAVDSPSPPATTGGGNRARHNRRRSRRRGRCCCRRPPSAVSVPGPPMSTSSPAPPRSVSSPAPPMSTSSPSPPSRVSKAEFAASAGAVDHVVAAEALTVSRSLAAIGAGDRCLRPAVR